MLALAIAKHEGYDYNPSETQYWKQANNGLSSFLYVTTNHVNQQVIENIKLELKPDEYLLIVCKSFDANVVGEKNIEIKKIPQSILDNCEYGKDNYNLNVRKEETDDGEIDE